MTKDMAREELARLQAKLAEAKQAKATEPSQMMKDFTEAALCQEFAHNIMVFHTVVGSVIDMVHTAVALTLVKVTEHATECKTLEEFVDGLRKAQDALSKRA